MFELLLCSMFTILPDYLVRRYRQGKRIGKEITLFSVWYELRYGITGCAILTLSLITLIFYFHPSSHNVGSFFRTLTILPEKNGRVVEIYVDNDRRVKSANRCSGLMTAQKQNQSKWPSKKSNKSVPRWRSPRPILQWRKGIWNRHKVPMNRFARNCR